jgi:O-glycosyl hydrolase
LPVVVFGLFVTVAEGQDAAGQEAGAENNVAVTKVETPNWWVDLTPEVMLLLSGRGLDATHVSCNLPTITVQRTQSSAGGKSRVTDEERILVAFNNAGEARELSVPVTDTPVQNVADISVLSGNASAVRAGNSIKISMPAQSITIFAVN